MTSVVEPLQTTTTTTGKPDITGCCCYSDDDDDQDDVDNNGSDRSSVIGSDSSEFDRDDDPDASYDEDDDADENEYDYNDEEWQEDDEMSWPRLMALRCWRFIAKYYTCFQVRVKALVEHKYFQQALLGAILINTLSMGIEYHNQVSPIPFLIICLLIFFFFKIQNPFFQPEELTLTVEFSNIVFSAIFAIEMLLKIIAEGPLNYIGNGFNVFDGVIVILR